MLLTPNNRSLILAALFVMVTGNLSLIHSLLVVYPPTPTNLLFLGSLVLFFSCSTVLFFLLVCHGKIGKWVLALLLIIASIAAYFMDTFGIIIDDVMISSILQTDAQETAGLISGSLILRMVLFGFIPAWIMWKYSPPLKSPKTETKSKLGLMLILLILMIGCIASFSGRYATFIREHKITRYYANPTYLSYSAFKFFRQRITSIDLPEPQHIAKDAVHMKPEYKHELLILVVGETARADHFSLNGYSRLTNPQLAKEDVVSLGSVSACATSTGESVPCMFSGMARKDFDREKALRYENVLDVLAESGVEILWRDNNSDSKGVATRIPYQNFRSPTLNPICNPECRDIGMLNDLDDYIQLNKEKDILIVLHQMGNHGPEYYRRYPKEFERFSPVCKQSDLGLCSREEIINAYDNAILYTDYFLSQIIKLLKKYDEDYETAMLYVADHGESLGENGFYLHAMPYAIAPKEQTHIPAILWLGDKFDLKLDQLRPFKNYPFSHEDLLCTLFIGFEIMSKTCDSRMQILLKNKDKPLTSQR